MVYPDFDAQFATLFNTEHRRLFRFLDRLSGDPELAADLAQDAFMRLYRRGSLPDRPHAWLLTVAMNLFRNAHAMRMRRARLLTFGRAECAHSDAVASPDRTVDESERLRVRGALDQLAERDAQMLLLRAEGYSYGDIAEVLNLNESSVGTLLARAKQAFCAAYGEPIHAAG
jgi:RNA polymerase sigma factor (sigma-70 family)